MPWPVDHVIAVQFEARVRMAGSALGLWENGSTCGRMPWPVDHVRAIQFEAV